MTWPLQPLQPLQKTQLQPLFGPSLDSLCHPCITTTRVSYSVLSLKLPPPPCAVLPVSQNIVREIPCFPEPFDTWALWYLCFWRLAGPQGFPTEHKPNTNRGAKLAWHRHHGVPTVPWSFYPWTHGNHETLTQILGKILDRFWCLIRYFGDTIWISDLGMSMLWVYIGVLLPTWKIQRFCCIATPNHREGSVEHLDILEETSSMSDPGNTFRHFFGILMLKHVFNIF